MKRRRSFGLWFVMAGGVLIVAFLVFFKLGENTDGNRLRVARDTTRVTEHLNAKGLPDYVAVLNKQLAKGVSPEANAEVALRKILGPKQIPRSIRQRYYQLIGLPLPSEEIGDYFASWADHLRSRGEDVAVSASELDQAMSGPWNARQYPALAEWIEQNNKHLDAAVEATTHSQMYVPLINDREDQGPTLFALLLPACHQHRELSNALICRAMQRIEKDELKAAWQDLLACHRLARLVSRGGTLTEAIVGLSIENAACEADRVLATSSPLSADLARSMASDLRRLPAMPSFARHFDHFERFGFLDTALSVAEYGPSALHKLSGNTQPPAAQQLADQLARNLVTSAVDWNEVLRIGNQFYDRIAKAAAADTSAERQQRAEAIERDLQQLKQPGTPLVLVTGTPKQRARAMANELMRLHLPFISATLRSQDAALSQLQLASLTFLLVAYKAETGHYPTDLGELVPDYTDAAPQDPLSGTSFHYRRDGRQAVLYGVGPNQRDDGGNSYRDDRHADDFVVRLP